MGIDWDPAKAAANRRKHGVNFSDVERAFYDEFALCIPDVFASGEERYILVGADALGRVVTVCYTYCHSGIRVISARRATASERRDYEKRIRL